MEVKIYVDVLFIINFIIDYILLWITSFFLKKSPIFLRLAVGAAIGAVFAATAFFLPMNIFFSLVSSVSTAFLMVVVTFGAKKTSQLLKNTFTFYLVSASASGIGFGLIFSGKSKNLALNNGIFYADINAYSLLFAFIAAFFIIHAATGYIKKQKIKSSFLYDVTIERNGRTISDTALFDSGNFARDPISKKSIIIAEWKSVAPLFDEEKITQAIVNNPKDFLYVGCRGIDGVTGMYAFSPDSVSSCEITFEKQVLVAVTDKPLDKDGDFRIILPNTSKIQHSQERI